MIENKRHTTEKSRQILLGTKAADRSSQYQVIILTMAM
jgi:hypothetical protein